MALAQVLRRAEMFATHEVQLEALSVRDRMANVLARVQDTTGVRRLPRRSSREEEGRMGVVVSFLAIMELVREGLVEFVQAGAVRADSHTRRPREPRSRARVPDKLRRGNRRGRRR